MDFKKWIEAETRCSNMETEIRQQVTKETETELKKMEDIYMTSLKREVHHFPNNRFYL